MPGPLILAIEDEALIRRFLRASLTGNGYRLEEAATGGEGLALAATLQPDVILLDLGLPDMDGLEVTRRLREWTQVPIVVLSARGQESDKVVALDAGGRLPDQAVRRARTAGASAWPCATPRERSGALEDPVFQVDELKAGPGAPPGLGRRHRGS